MNPSFLTSLIQRFYPSTAEKVQTLIASNVLLEKLAVNVYGKLEASLQKYADIAERLKVIARMSEAWRKQMYRDISYASFFICITILLYFISPIDLIPDFIPFIGGLDDVLLLAYMLKVIDKEIEKFLDWERHNIPFAS